ncbi:MAG: hypothetical protein AB1458_00420 [Bacteroidota bacterium]
MSEDIKYPAYRKYKNHRSFFKIISPSEFEEVKVEAGKYTFHRFAAQILPDRNLIYDLTFNYSAHCDEIGEEEFEAAKQKAEKK